MKSFTLGAVAGISALALAVPFLAQGTIAASSSSAPSKSIPTQVCVQALVTRDEAALTAFDARTAAEKTALTTRKDALAAAALITDDTQRLTAVKAAEESFRTAMKAVADSQGDEKTQMDAIRTACGNARFRPMMGRDSGGRGFGRGPGKDDLAQKLGMTETELKAALDGGKTIQQIAEEKGVTLPTSPQGMRGMMRGGRGSEGAQETN